MLISMPANDYDTWKQYVKAAPGGPVHSLREATGTNINAVEGEFVYQMQNDTLSCLTIELRWGFAPPRHSDEDVSASTSGGTMHGPQYECAATPLAMNWDCHLDWALVTECSYNSTSNTVSALYTVTNMGAERVEGEGKVIIIHKHGDEEERVRVVGSSRSNKEKEQ